MGGVVSTHRYTDAHFAATLLAVGPHVTDCGVCLGDGTKKVCPNVTRYKDRVYAYFYQLFPEVVNATNPNTLATRMDEWTTFWSEYIRWIGVPP